KTIIRPDSLPLPLIQPLPPLMPADTAATPLLAEADASKKRFTEMEQNNVLRRGVQLKQVDIKAKKKVYSSSPGGRQFADQVIEQDRIEGSYDLRSALEMNNPDIRFDKLGIPHNIGHRSLYDGFDVVVDGVLLDLGMLQQINPNEVQSIEILYNGTALGVKNNVIVINTKLRDPYHNYSKDVVAGMKAIKIQGYYQSREFYIPKYDAENKKADLRDVVYWNPDIIPDE
ncbi:hypothetical protein, partial [Mucilaginibacter segetis]